MTPVATRHRRVAPDDGHVCPPAQARARRACRYLADAAARTALTSADLRDQRISLVLHSGAGLLVMLVPRGRTRYGWRKQHEMRVVPEW